MSLPSVPNSLHSMAKPIYHRLPLRARAPRVYWATLELLRASEQWDEQQIRDYQLAQLREMLAHCAKHVPYYRSLFRRVGFDPAQMRDPSDLRNIPMLDRLTVRERWRELLAENIGPESRVSGSTGGTLGQPLELYSLRGASWRERAFMEHLWARVGFRRRHVRAILRGSETLEKRDWIYDPRERAVIFSHIRLDRARAAAYAEIMKRRRLRFLHCYPSSMVSFAKYLKESNCEPPTFQAILVGSENMNPSQETFARQFYGCRVFSWLGHSENVVLAGYCETRDLYHVSPQYGFVEVIGTSGESVGREGDWGELVGTSLYNKAMPLLRYRSGDWAELGPSHCACGRKHQLLKNVIGRRDQEVLVGRAGNPIALMAVDVSSHTFRHVRQFQFEQSEPGRADLRIVKGPEYSPLDSAMIVDEIRERTGGSLDISLAFVQEIPLTARGKVRQVIQRIPHAPSV